MVAQSSQSEWIFPAKRMAHLLRFINRDITSLGGKLYDRPKGTRWNLGYLQLGKGLLQHQLSLQ